MGLYVNYPPLLSHFNETWISSTGFRKILKYQILLKFVLCEPTFSMLADGQTDVAELKAFRDFAKAPNNASNGDSWARNFAQKEEAE